MNAEFVDSNILIYAYAPGAGERHSVAVDLMARLAGQNVGAISTQVLMEFFSIATGKLRMKSEAAEEVIEYLVDWPTHRPTHRDVINAIHLQRRYKLSWWDAMIVNSAIESQARILWSEDLSDGQRYGSLTVRNPFQ